MDSENKIYRDLQTHLNRQPVGFPPSKTGADLRILRHIFTAEEAEIAMKLSYKFQPVEKISEGLEGNGITEEELLQKLDEMFLKGGIDCRETDGSKYYRSIPLVVGMYEYQLNRLTPEFLSDMKEYTSDKSYGLEFLATELPQMRTIPIEQGITREHHVATYDDVRSLIDKSHTIVIVECICRKAKRMNGEECQKTSRLDTCMVLNNYAVSCLQRGAGRQITREEALEIMHKNEEEGLVLQPSNAEEAEFICSCCGCCCGMLNLHHELPRPVDFWATNYHAEIDSETCSGCGTCVDSCQVYALSLNEDKGISEVDLTKCIGCGNCVATCTTGAIQLINNEEVTVPPATENELYDTIMENKKGMWGKIKLTLMLVLGMKK